MKTFLGKSFSCVSSVILKGFNNVFLGVFQNFWECSLFKSPLSNHFNFKQKWLCLLFLMSLLSLLSVFNEDVCATKFATRFFWHFLMRSYFMVLKSIFDFKKNLTKACGIIFWKMLPLGLKWVNKWYHMNYPMLLYVKQ